MKYKHHFFMGTQSVNGFVSLFKNLNGGKNGYETSLIKAGPGCGKSTFMKSIGKKLIDQNLSVEFIHCSADPNSLDGVICREKNYAIIDATDPHDEKPLYPGACETVVSFYQFNDNDQLKANKTAIINYFEQCSRYHERVARFVSSARLITEDIIKSCLKYIDMQKLHTFLDKLVLKTIPPLINKNPNEEYRYINAVTPKGLIDFSKINSENYDNCYVFSDKYGAVSSVSLGYIRKKALQNGYEIITCRSALCSENITNAIFIPKAGICFLTNNFLSKNEYPNAKTINEKRFMNIVLANETFKQAEFCKKAVLGLIDNASKLSQKALSNHDEIEKFYVASMDFESLSDMQQKYLDKHIDLI